MSIGIQHPETTVRSLYRQPTLDEMLDLCVDFELVADLERDGEFMRMNCRGERFNVSVREAELLVRGLLIGYFAMQTRDDLGLATWEN